jgi:hypothetical protein
MANPRLSGYPALSAKASTYRVTPDLIHDYEYNVRNALSRLDPSERINDPTQENATKNLRDSEPEA